MNFIKDYISSKVKDEIAMAYNQVNIEIAQAIHDYKETNDDRLKEIVRHNEQIESGLKSIISLAESYRKHVDSLERLVK